ncbi:YitT family protein [Hathewaya histolytica]|uniref:Transporter n=1 Tax=Hathewaya histolytica TaxID=1498 RepID=A0A4U9RGB8_HATHI|nr:YitT family protein [Hathewaya histolytica]VTQ90924.1 transporter [Hathewaya histolytica]
METLIDKKAIKKDRSIRFFTVLLGTLIYSISVNMFITPHKLIAGGVAGIALIIQYITKIPSGYFVFLINIPLFIIGIKELDKEFGVYSLIGMISMSIFLVITKDITSVFKVNDILVSTICGGAFCGLGMGIIFRSRASEGGTDIISVIVKKRYGVKISTITFIINILIVSVGGFLGTFEIAVYTIISMYLKSMVLDKVIEGLDKKKLIFVVTRDPEGVKKIILEKLGRGVTFLHGEGAYTGETKKMIYSVMSSKQLARFKLLINTVDSKAVITIMDVSEVEGKGFKKAAF